MNISTNHSPSLGSIFTLNGDEWQKRMAKMSRRKQNEKQYLFLISLICTLGGLLFGYSTGVTNGAFSFIQKDFQLNSTMLGILTGSLLIGAAFGAFIGGHLVDQFGRRRITLGNSVLFIFGTLSSSLASNFYIILVARSILGLAVGCASATVPMFLAELALPEKRGQMVTRNELMIVIGQLIAFLSNAILGTIWEQNQQIWRWMLSIGIIPAIGLLLGTLVIVPESPRWLISKSRNEQAMNVLRRIRGNEAEAIGELYDIREMVEENQKMSLGNVNSIQLIFSESWVRSCILIGIGITLCQQITGVNSIMFFGTEILRNTGLTNGAALMANIANGVVSVLAAFFSIWLLGRMPRRKMLISAQIAVIFVHFLLGICQMFLPDGTPKEMLVLFLCVAFLAFQQGSISPVTWLLIAEIFPLRIRGLAISLTTFLLWIVNSIVGILFPILTNTFGISCTFLAFSLFNVFAVIFSFFCLPETQGKSLEELEQQFKMEDWPRLRRAGNLDVNDAENLEDEIKRKNCDENEGQQKQFILP